MNRRKDGLYQQELPKELTGGKRKVVYGKTKSEVLRKIADYQEEAEKLSGIANHYTVNLQYNLPTNYFKRIKNPRAISPRINFL